ncbi:ribosomal RNA small subunit methyltransferase A [bacterium]|nr:ribosomal RNA small subunit methyltransferase A [bacterium]NBX49354.1 ribosomal RNA small subunit methyltransferase A [bacterium]
MASKKPMHGIKQPLGAKKRFGQHFLRDASVIKKILAAVPWEKAEKIVEVGPGHGALTGPLYEKLQQMGKTTDLMLVELDRDLLPELEERFPDAHIVNADATHADWKKHTQGKPWVLVGNLPYNAGTAIVNEAFWGEHPPLAAVIMLQKEVGERMLATPPDMSLLSVAIQVKTEGKRVCTVKPGAFVPPPKVDSIVILLTHREMYAGEKAKRVVSLAKKGFAHARKQLRQTLAHEGLGEKERLGEVLESYGLSALARPEELPLAAWATIDEHRK